MAAFVEKREPRFTGPLMQAVVLEGIGGPEELVLRDVPEPLRRRGPGRRRRARLGDQLPRGPDPARPLPADARAARGSPASEVAGTTEDGRRVLGLVRTSGGGYAELAAVDEQWLFDLPAEASFEEGAAFLMAYLTAWIPLTRQARSAPARGCSSTPRRAGSAAPQSSPHATSEPRSSRPRARPRSSSSRSRSAPSRRSPTTGSAEIEPVDVVLDPVGGQLFADSIPLLRPLGVAVAIGFAGGLWPPLDPALLVGRNVGVQGFYLGRLMQRQPALVREAALELLRLWSAGIVHPIVGATFPLERGGRGAPPDRGAALDGQGRARPVKAIVTGGASGLGAAIVARLACGGLEVEVLDLTTGFDVTDPDRWDTVGPVDVACLNAGVLGGPSDPAEITLDELPARDGGQRRRRRPRRQAPGAGDARGRQDRRHRVARRPDRDAGRPGLRGHEARRRRASSAASPRPSPPAASRSTRSAPASPTRRCSPARRARRSTRPASRSLARDATSRTPSGSRSPPGSPGTRGRCSPAGHRSTSASRTSPAPRTAGRASSSRRRPLTAAMTPHRASRARARDRRRSSAPYSQAVASGDHVFLSGQTPIDPATGSARRRRTSPGRRSSCFDNLAAVLAAAGLGLDDVDQGQRVSRRRWTTSPR